MYSNSTQRLILYLAALLSLVAAFIHVLVTPEHFAEWWGYGSFFLATVIAQTMFAPVVLQWPRRSILIAGIAGNAAIAVMWVVSRFIGIPFFGPGAGEVEPVGSLDVICTAAEIALIALLLVPAMAPARLTQRRVAGRGAHLAVRRSTAA